MEKALRVLAEGIEKLETENRALIAQCAQLSNDLAERDRSLERVHTRAEVAEEQLATLRQNLSGLLKS